MKTKADPKKTGIAVEREWIARSKLLAPANRKSIESALRNAYKSLTEEDKIPSVTWVRSPLEGVAKAAKYIQPVAAESHSTGALEKLAQLRRSLGHMSARVDNKKLKCGASDALLHSLGKCDSEASMKLDDTTSLSKVKRWLGADLEAEMPNVTKVVSTEISLRVGEIKEHEYILGQAIRTAIDSSANALAIHDYLYRVFRLSKELLPVIHAADAGWYWLLPEAIIVSERPTKLTMNERGQLHCKDAPAVEYGDGFSVYALNNAWMPEDQILNNSADWNDVKKVSEDVREAVVSSKIDKWKEEKAADTKDAEERTKAAEAIFSLGGIDGVRDLIGSGE